MRPSQRSYDALRPVSFTRQFTAHAEGSVLVCFGQTKVICTASVSDTIPRFLKGQGQGWLTAEYGMLPRATHDRIDREAAKGKQTGRTQEIQRLIGRALRSAIDLKQLGERTIHIDCDVIQADGGTRTAAITGSAVALADALNGLQAKGKLKTSPLKHMVAAVSVGMFEDQPILDLDYAEDSKAQTDMNIVMNADGEFIEVQGTAEGIAFKRTDLDAMLSLAESGIQQLLQTQREALGLTQPVFE